MSVSEEQLSRWAQAPSETEDQKCENAISSITNVIHSHFGKEVYITKQGSHKNRTNIKADSDVDIAVIHGGYYFPDISGLSDADRELYNKNNPDSNYRFDQFKNEVHELLQKNFDIVERKNKCIRITGNSYRVNADVVPAFEHRRYKSYGVIGVEGIAFHSDKGELIYGFPEQHYENGVKKNENTAKNYKSAVRIIKRIRNEFVEKGLMKLSDMPSFFIESLVWNVENSYIAGKTWRELVESVSAKIWNDMRNPEIANSYAEVSDLQWLFRGQTKRTPKQAEDFMLQVYNYVKN
ncbi:MAG: nucleotidyltransferase [Candidatus Paceibacterota bacterium]